jgi:hypothetical protein
VWTPRCICSVCPSVISIMTAECPLFSVQNRVSLLGCTTDGSTPNHKEIRDELTPTSAVGRLIDLEFRDEVTPSFRARIAWNLSSATFPMVVTSSLKVDVIADRTAEDKFLHPFCPIVTP